MIPPRYSVVPVFSRTDYWYIVVPSSVYVNRGDNVGLPGGENARLPFSRADGPAWRHGDASPVARRRSEPLICRHVCLTYIVSVSFCSRPGASWRGGRLPEVPSLSRREVSLEFPGRRYRGSLKVGRMATSVRWPCLRKQSGALTSVLHTRFVGALLRPALG